MKVLVIASALGLLLVAGGCSSHRGHYGRGNCGNYWSNFPQASVQPEMLAATSRISNHTPGG